MRQGRLGFPRPLGDILSEFRPLIQDKFANAPRNIGAVATKFDKSDFSRDVTLTRAEDIWFIDFLMNLDGVDEFSRSSLGFDNDGKFVGGMVRVSTLVPSDSDDVDEEARIIDSWDIFLQQKVGLKFSDDDVDTLIRKNPGASGQSDKLTPHVIFTSKDPTGSSKQSPLSTGEVVKILENIKDEWPGKMGEFRTAGRVLKGEDAGGSEETVGSVSDMLDNL